MMNLDATHNETQTTLPGPLTSPGFFNPGTWALPATTVSVASIAVSVTVFLSLITSELRRSLFTLPFEPAFAAVAAALFAWLALIRCRDRPGRHLPRIWALVLMALTTVAAGLSLLGPRILSHHPLFQVAALALLAGTLALLPRLLKVRPQSPMTQRVAPLSLVFTLSLVLPSAFYMGQSAISTWEQRIDGLVSRLGKWTDDVREVAAFDWKHFADQPEAARATVDKLTSVDPAPYLRDPYLWKAATTLERTEGLDKTLRDLAEALVAGLDPEITPKLSTLGDPAIWWDPEARRWQANSLFPELSEITGKYHRELARAFFDMEVDEAARDYDVLAALDDFHTSKRAELKGFLEAALHTWADHWVVFQVPRHAELVGRDRITLDEVLKMPMSGNGLAPGSLSKLLDLSYATVRELADDLPGCHRRGPYSEEDFEYYRLDCYTYSPAQKSAGADLRLDMRVVYKSAEAKPLSRHALPVEIYFLFPIPKAEDHDEFRDTVMNGLRIAVKELGASDLRIQDRGGTVNNGFLFPGPKGRISVNKPRIIHYYDQQNAVEVRAVPVKG